MPEHAIDFWTQTVLEAPVKPTSAGQITQIGKVTPLAKGPGEDLGVPEILLAPLFGPVDGSAETPASYTVLDAAKIANLPILLDSSGLEHRCLFMGDALRDLGEVAPWLVRLDRDNRFVRRLFTEGPPPVGLWHPEAGIFCRSNASLDELWQHFRKSVKLKDESGKWFYFRFWEPTLLPVLNDQMHAVLFPTRSPPLLRVIAPTKSQTYLLSLDRPPQTQPVREISSNLRGALHRKAETHFALDFAETLARTAPIRMRQLGLTDSSAVAEMVGIVTERLRPLGFRKRSDIGRIAACGLFYGSHFLSDPRIAPLANRLLGQQSRDPSLRARDFQHALRNNPDAAAMLDPETISHVIRNLHASPHETDQYPPGLSPVKAAAHVALARILTPFFLADPLRKVWRDIFALPDNVFAIAARTELNRMSNPIHGVDDE